MTDECHKERNAGDIGGLSRRLALIQSTAGVAALASALGGCATSSKVQGRSERA
jgi:hypothetical protein